MIKQNLERRTWQQFRKTGLFMFINSILHAFGWVIVVQTNDSGEITESWPARTKFRGFGADDYPEMYQKITSYLAENAKDFPEEIKD